MVSEAATKALDDAKISYREVQQVCAGYILGDSTCGQKSVYQLGMTGIPVYNVNNNAATGSTTLFLGKQLIQGGIADCVLAFGFEKMYKESVLRPLYSHCAYPMEDHVEVVKRTYGVEKTPILAQLFGNAGREHMEKYGTTPEHFIKIAYKNHKHCVNNPPVSDGAAAVVMASEEFVKKNGLEEQAVEFLAMELTTDLPSTFSENSCIKMVGYDMIKLAADRVFENAVWEQFGVCNFARLYNTNGVTRDDVDVVELHDCFSTYELISYEALGLCPEGEGAKMVDKGDNTYGGKYVINPSGGLVSKGHPISASGVAQCVEISKHLRNQAGKRQVPGAKIGLQHNIGLGGACVVALYKLGFPKHDV